MNHSNFAEKYLKRRGILAMQLMVTFTAMVSITLQQIGKISY